MEKALRAYGAVLRLVRRLPKDTRPYYAKFARENFVNYRDVETNDSKALDELFNRAYTHSIWVLNKVPSLFMYTCRILETGLKSKTELKPVTSMASDSKLQHHGRRA
ncbi:hypothetical protein L1049_014972 [Liquidambar formosana]|uniref:Complex 1 LYR protein domain-containing protein n=1 Tax=Liquidambar formosana TaxID=63359 RepID=A0AAP0RY67_LIQFO